MNFLELTRKRCSIRSYIDRKVEPEKIRYILEAGAWPRRPSTNSLGTCC